MALKFDGGMCCGAQKLYLRPWHLIAHFSLIHLFTDVFIVAQPMINEQVDVISGHLRDLFFYFCGFWEGLRTLVCVETIICQLIR